METYRLTSLLLYFLSIDGFVRNMSTASTERPPVALQDIGYDDTWEKFCDRKQIDKDFAFYPHHSLRSLRIEICKMKENNKINRKSLSAFFVYKYCEMTRFRAEDFLDKVIARFSQEDDEKKSKLLAPGPLIDKTQCFKLTMVAFEKTCVDKENPFFRMFEPLLARACTLRWLTTDNILSSIDEICSGKKMTSDINWDPIINSVYCRGESNESSSM